MVAAIFVGCLSAGSAGSQEPAAPWRVLILDSTDPSEPLAQSFGGAIREGLTARASRRIDFYSEFLDSLRFRGSSYESELVAFLKSKYEGRRPDIVITVFPDALHFLERHRRELWPEAPAVFLGVLDDMPEARAPALGMTGVGTRVDFAGTLDLALRLQPRTRRVVVVSGASDFDRLWRRRAERALQAYAGRLEPSYLEVRSLPDLLATVAHLPPDTIVLQTTVFRDAQGSPRIPGEVTTRLAEASSVPVYSSFETALGKGIVGGSMVGLEAQGRRAGELAARILGVKGRRRYPSHLRLSPCRGSTGGSCDASGSARASFRQERWCSSGRHRSGMSTGGGSSAPWPSWPFSSLSS